MFETHEAIFARKQELQAEVSELLENTGSEYTFEDILDIIYDEEDQDDFHDLLGLADAGGDASDLSNAIETLTDAWNVFAHRSLGGLSPAEMLLMHKEG